MLHALAMIKCSRIGRFAFALFALSVRFAFVVTVERIEAVTQLPGPPVLRSRERSLSHAIGELASRIAEASPEDSQLISTN